jgi:hypothetical protein
MTKCRDLISEEWFKVTITIGLTLQIVTFGHFSFAVIRIMIIVNKRIPVGIARERDLMSEASQDRAKVVLPFSAAAQDRPAKPKNWLTGAVRALGIGNGGEASVAGTGGFDFLALHRSLASLERKSAAGE